MERQFGLWTAVSMVVGLMIGAGIFVVPSSLAPFGWTSVAGWIVVGTGALTIARVIAELHARYPQEPSVITIAGDILGLLASRLIALSYWVGLVVAAAVVAIGATDYIFFLIPLFTKSAWLAPLVAILILFILAGLNLRGARAAGQFQVVTTLLKLLPLVFVIGVIGFLGFTGPETFTQSQARPFQISELTSAIGVMFFVALGYEGASLVAQRVRDPERNVVRATIYGLLLVLVIYFITSVGIVLSTPFDELNGASAPLAAFASKHAGSWAGYAIAVFAAISAIGCLNAIVLLIGEVPFAMTRDGQLPEWIAPGSDQGVGQRPLLVGTGVAAVIILMSSNALGGEVLDFLLRLAGATAVWFYAGICVVAAKSGIKRPLALVGLGYCGWVLYGTGLETSALGIGLMIVGVALHFMIGGRTRPRGSVPA